jgi:predicted dehydrogenase
MTLRSQYPAVRFTSRIDDLLHDELLDAVVLGTPVVAHHELASRLIEAEKHVLLKRVLALRSEDADDLVKRAQRAHRRIVVAQPLLYHPAIRRLKELIDSGYLGDIYYLSCFRSETVNPTDDGGIPWKLGAAKIAAILHLLGDEPIEVFARGDAYIRPEVADIAVCYLKFATGISASVHLSCLDPIAKRTLTVVGADRAALVETLRSQRALFIHERGGDVMSPKLPPVNPMRIQCEQFVHAVRLSRQPPKGIREARKVVTVLEAIQRSLESGKAQDVVEEPGVTTHSKVIPLPVEKASERRRASRD